MKPISTKELQNPYSAWEHRIKELEEERDELAAEVAQLRAQVEIQKEVLDALDTLKRFMGA